VIRENYCQKGVAATTHLLPLASATTATALPIGAARIYSENPQVLPQAPRHCHGVSPHCHSHSGYRGWQLAVKATNSSAHSRDVQRTP
jgi:hypothetical protein